MKCKNVLFVILGVLVAMTVSASAMLHEVTVTAGQLYGVGNDSSTPFDSYSWGFAAYDMGGDGKLDLVLDMGAAESVGILEVVNADRASNGAIALLEIYVASTEGGVGFDSTNVANYDTKVYGEAGLVPADISALAVRTADINDCSKRYFLLHITSAYWGAPSPCFFNDIRNKSFAGFPVTAGSFFTVGDDSPVGNVYVDPNFYAVYDSGNGSVDIVLDAEVSTYVGAIQVVNRMGNSTNYNIALANIYVASDEGGSFNPADVNSYTVKVFGNGTFSPANGDAGTVRTADINDCRRRYFLIHITDTWAGFPAMFSDLRITSGGFPVSGGSICPTNDGDILEDLHAPNPDTFSFYEINGDGVLMFVLDTQSVKYVKALKLINSIQNSNYNVGLTEILVASDEGALGFNPMAASSYTEKVYDGVFLPNSGSSLVERTADIDDVHKRYFLFKIKSFVSGDIDLGENAVFDDVDYIDDPITDCQAVKDFGLTLAGDLNQDCKVSMADMSVFAEQWLGCTNPSGIGCVKTSESIPTYAIVKVPTGGIAVNGDLSDWPSDSEWIWLNKKYSGDSPWDVTEAKFSVRWSDVTDKIYLAVVVNDPDRTFITYNYAADELEIYSQGSAAGGTGWGAGGTDYYDVAQQYFVGADGSGGQWTAWANLALDIGTDAEFESAVVVSGNVITYEVGIKQFNNYGGLSGGTTEIAALEPGIYVGFDVIVDTVFSGGNSMISENLFTGKYNDAGQFQQYELVNTLPQQYCGDWGYLGGDFDENCRVNFEDFATLGLQWMTCNDPQGVNCIQNW